MVGLTTPRGPLNCGDSIPTPVSEALYGASGRIRFRGYGLSPFQGTPLSKGDSSMMNVAQKRDGFASEWLKSTLRIFGEKDSRVKM
ncbi:hypothetical protein GCM10011362_27600 [Marinobacter halophilus]|nr:hypothetical protein GCM10011362_27600 [Marinobacter halophilus]